MKHLKGESAKTFKAQMDRSLQGKGENIKGDCGKNHSDQPGCYEPFQ